MNAAAYITLAGWFGYWGVAIALMQSRRFNAWMSRHHNA